MSCDICNLKKVKLPICAIHGDTINPIVMTIKDDEGNEILFRIHLTIDGQEEFGKDYVLLYDASSPEGEEVELLAYAYEQKDGEAEGRLTEIDSEAEWNMIEEVFNAFEAEEE